MLSFKPAVDQKVIMALLEEAFAAPTQELTVLSGGLSAQTLSFRAGGKAYILRINPGSFDVGFR